MMKKRCRFLPIPLLYLPCFSLAFTATVVRKRPAASSRRLNAYVFPEPDQFNTSFRGDVLLEKNVESVKIPNVSSEFISFINKESAALARLAVAYSPKDRTINIKNINQVSVLNLGENSMDIAALVCDNDSCVSLAVPVSFPRTCKDATSTLEFESCIIANLGELNTLASETVEHTQKVSEEHEKMAPLKLVASDVVVEEEKQNKMLEKELKSSNDLELPHWWEHPKLNMKLGKDCDNVRSLLNQEEFQYDLQILVSKTIEGALRHSFEASMADSGKLDLPIETDIDGLRYHGAIDENTPVHINPNIQSFALENGTGNKDVVSRPAVIVDKVAIAALGPAGMILKASISSNYFSKLKYKIIDISFPFKILVKDEESLRDAVLQIVDEVQVQDAQL